MRGVSLLAPLAATLAVSDALRVNGWYPCTVSEPGTSWPDFECATVELPLCHASVCESDRTIDVFVKRKLAVMPSMDEIDKSIWFLEGGPGASSVNLEQAMLLLYNFLNETVNVYTMDHRGTGRSAFLQCNAAQAFADGSPSGSDVEFSELPACIDDVLFEMDNQTAAYSVTSAALDVAALLDEFSVSSENDDEQSEQHVFLYGVSYGTYLVERVMHVAPPKVKGYILDGVLPETGYSITDWNKVILSPTRRFFEVCADSPECPLRFESKATVVDEVLQMYDDIDSATSSACLFALEPLMSAGMTPSDALRTLLGMLVRYPWYRELVPSILQRVHRCSATDVAQLNQAMPAIFQEVGAIMGGTASSIDVDSEHMITILVDPVTSINILVYDLITLSELWHSPVPTVEQILEQYQSGPLSENGVDFATFCILTAQNTTDWERVCPDVLEWYATSGYPLPSATPKRPFTYDVDAYWNKTATIPEGASALLVVGGLDFQTPQELGEHQYDTLVGANKMLVEFQYGVHGSGFLPTTDQDMAYCGPTILASYVAVDGDVTLVDTSCMTTLPHLQLTDQTFGRMMAAMTFEETSK